MKIKHKFILFFAPLFAVGLMVVSFMSIQVFQRDKIAYVYSTTLESAQAAASQITSEIHAQRPLMEMMISTFDFAKKKFPEEAKAYLQLTHSLQFIRVEGLASGGYQTLDTLGSLPPDLDLGVSSSGKDEDQRIEPLLFSQRRDLWGLSQSFQMKGYSPSDYRLTLIFKRNPIAEMLDRPRYFDLFLLAPSRDFSFATTVLNEPRATDLVRDRKSQIIRNPASASTSEQSLQNDQDYLIAWAPISGTDLGVVAVTSKSKAISAIDQMKRTSLGVLLLLLALGLFAVFFLIDGLTSNIELLTACLDRFAQGDLKVKTNIDGKDEIGRMAKVFNSMTERIRQLMSEMVDKTRMSSELETARNVQQRMVPENQFDTEEFSILGHFEPASECGGDWWHYSVDHQVCTLIISDVTGHGVASALMTAALRAGVSALRTNQNQTLDEFVMNLNRVICESGHQKIMTTALIAQIDLTTGEMKYVNASHLQPAVIGDGSLSKREIDFLMEIGGPRLGEDPSSVYHSSRYQLEPGDLLFLSTDGLNEFQNSEGKYFGERRVFRNLSKSAEDQSHLTDFQESLLREFKKFQGQTLLPDDLTFFFFHFRKKAEISNSRARTQEAG